MDTYLNRSIKQIIQEFPAVEKILEDYGIGCGPCAVGLCLLKDIVGVHSLEKPVEQELMARIENLIYPERGIQVPQRKPEEGGPKPGEIKYSPPVKKLVDEHVWIKRWIALIPKVAADLDLASAEDRRLLLEGIDFIRSYADKFHHAKEEEILFKYFDENLEILQAMHEDHRRGRNHVKAVLEGLEGKDKEAVAEHLLAYRELLTEHIRKEDEILYPWMDRSLSVSQVGELYARFQAAEENIGYAPQKYEDFVARTEATIIRKEEE